MITDRQRVERVLFPMLLIDVLINGVDDKESPIFKEATALLWLTVREAVADLDKKGEGKIMRRVRRTHEELLEGFKNAEARCDKIGLVVFYMLQTVTDCDYLVLPEESPMAKAMDLVIPALMPAAEIEKVNASAMKAARKALRSLKERSLFEGVPVP